MSRRRICVIAAALVVASLVALPVLAAGSTQYFTEMLQRAREGKTTAADRTVLRTMYNSMIEVGGVDYPEAALILKHYLAGDSSDLELAPDAFRKSPAVLHAIRGRREGTVGPVWVNELKEPRVGYAVNGFFITLHTEHGHTSVHVHQRIAFDPLKGGTGVRTRFRVGALQAAVPDALIHVFDDEGCCKPFEVHARWTR